MISLGLEVVKFTPKGEAMLAIAKTDLFKLGAVEQYPELSDSANNIHFMRQSEMGRR